MNEFLKVVDLGTKLGTAIDVFLKRGAMYYGEPVGKISKAECLGVDLADKYQKDVEKRGYQFKAMDVLKDFNYPVADYYLAWDFLEHLPSIEDSNNVLAAMLDHAIKGVWLKMPSFEQDNQGEGQLRKHGLRFTWTHWHGHPSFYKVDDATAVINRVCAGCRIKHKTQRIIRDSSSEFVVPIDAPVDTTKYNLKEHGPKPSVVFDPPVIGCHELIVNME
jgi:hypothetical protein